MFKASPLPEIEGWNILSKALCPGVGINTVAAAMMAFWIGAVNAVTTLAFLLERSSHVSGRITDAGIHFTLHPVRALLVFLIWAAFVAGSFLAGKVHHRLGLTRSLLVVAATVVVAALSIRAGFYAADKHDYGIGRMVIAVILPMAMGFQNAITTMTPGIGRTTHWTGDSTDIGLALATGNSAYAMHNLLKIFCFICGAALLGYLIHIRSVSPLLMLILAATGHLLTTLIFHGANQWWGRTPEGTPPNLREPPTS